VTSIDHQKEMSKPMHARISWRSGRRVFVLLLALLTAVGVLSATGTALAYSSSDNYRSVSQEYRGLIPNIAANNEQDYRTLNGDLRGQDDSELVVHWNSDGLREGRRGSFTFDVNYYRANNADLRGLSNVQAARHLVDNGIREGRNSSPVFNVGFYRAVNGDLAGFSNAALYDHYLRNGAREGRRASAEFDPGTYRARYGDLASLSNYDLIAHYLTSGRGEGRSGRP
jgi:hypothetical protein